MTAFFGPLDQSDRRYRVLVATAALVIIAAGIREAAPVLDSILLAALLAMAVVPAFDDLRRRGVSKGIAAALTTVLLAIVVLALVGFLGVAATRLVRALPSYQDKAEALRRGLEAWMVARGMDPQRVFSFDLLDPGRLLGLAQGFLAVVGKVVSQALLLLLIVAFILAERGVHGKAFQPGGIVEMVARDVRQYLVITAGTGLGFAVLVYILMRLVGTDLALVWAVLAFVMNFVPNVGIILSAGAARHPHDAGVRLAAGRGHPRRLRRAEFRRGQSDQAPVHAERPGRPAAPRVALARDLGLLARGVRGAAGAAAHDRAPPGARGVAGNAARPADRMRQRPDGNLQGGGPCWVRSDPGFVDCDRMEAL